MAADSGSSKSWDAPWSSGPGSLPHARAARALEVRAHPCCAPPPPAFSRPGSSPPVLSCLPTPRFPARSCPIIGKGGRVEGQNGGLLCVPTGLRRLLLEGQQQDKAGRTCGELLHSVGLGSRLPWGCGGGALHRFGNSRVIDKTETVT